MLLVIMSVQLRTLTISFLSAQRRWVRESFYPHAIYANKFDIIASKSKFSECISRKLQSEFNNLNFPISENNDVII